MSSWGGDVTVTGAVSAGNMYAASVWVTPVPNVPTMVEITGLSLRGSGPVQALATAHTTVPGTRVVEVGVAAVTQAGCQVWIMRKNNVETEIYVWMWREQ